ncbi:MAG: endonuclease/exonuclease/phosphatase family protein [Bacteroidota bacterium]
MRFALKVVIVFMILLPSMLIGQESIKILTYNLEGMKPGTNPGLRIALIISELKIINPDIIALQEINEDISGDGSDNQGLLIKNALSAYFQTEYYYYEQQTHLSWDNEFKEFVGIISKYPVNDKGYFQLVTGVFPRKVVWNRVSTPIGDINIFNTHLSFNSSAVRLEQVEQVDNYINSISTNNGIINNILCGDLNSTPTSTVIEFITDPSSEIYYHSSFKKANLGLPGYTVPSNNPNAKIDYVFYTSNSKLSVDTSYIVMDEPLGEDFYNSDHLGILSIFSIGDNTGIDKLQSINSKPFKLYPNYPNPCTSYTSIDFEIFDNKHIKMLLFNQQGAYVNTLLNQVKKPGRHNVKINFDELKDNIYFFVIEVDGYTETKKIVVLH